MDVARCKHRALVGNKIAPFYTEEVTYAAYRLPERLDDVFTTQGSRPSQEKPTTSQVLAVVRSPPPSSHRGAVASPGGRLQERRVGSAFLPLVVDQGEVLATSGRTVSALEPQTPTKSPSGAPVRSKNVFTMLAEDEDEDEDELPPLKGRLVSSSSESDDMQVVFDPASSPATAHPAAAAATPSCHSQASSAFSSPLTSPPASGPSTPAPTGSSRASLAHGKSFSFIYFDYC